MPGAGWQQGATQAIAPAESKWRERLGYADRGRVQAITEDLLVPLGYQEPARGVRLLMPLARVDVALRSLIPDALERRRRPKTPAARYSTVQALTEAAAEGARQ